MQAMTEGDKFYLAALFDGEGHFSATLDLRYTRTFSGRRYGFAEHVGVTNTNLAMLNWCLKTTRLGIIKPKSRSKANWKPAYEWTLSRAEIRDLVPTLLPYLKFKREQAELVLELLATTNDVGKSQLTDEQRSLRAAICSELADLNRRGQ